MVWIDGSCNRSPFDPVAILPRYLGDLRQNTHMSRIGKMLIRTVILAVALACQVSVADAQRRAQPETESDREALGPEMNEFMTFLDAEVAELTHLFEVGEVPPADFRRSRDRLAATREAAIRIARTRDDDRVPDLYVLMDAELTQILPTGTAAIRGKKAGDRVGDDFIFHGRIRRSSTFNVLERIGNIRRATPY